MRLTSLVRRSVSLTAATALVSGGLASGFLATAAHAADAACGNATGPCIDRVNPISPTYWDNSSTPSLVIHGSQLGAPLGSVSVTLTPHGHPELAISGITPSNASSATTDLDIAPNLTFAAPGPYDITVIKKNTLGQVSGTDTVTSYDADHVRFLVTNAGGRAKLDGATGVAPIAPGSALGKLKLTGHFFAPGARVDFLRASDNAVDTGLAFTAGNDTGDTATYPGYLDTSHLHGTYVADAATFTPGLHRARVVNLDNDGGGDTASVMADFWQPKFAAGDVSPTTVPQGAGGVAVTITNTLASFGPGSTLQVPALSADATCKAKEVSVTNPVVSADHKTITANVAIDACAPAGARSLSVVGPDGGYFTVANAITAKAAPTVTNVNGVTPYKIGQGADVQVPVNGTGFDSGATVATLPHFGFGNGVTATSVPDASDSATATLVHLQVAPDAATGNRQVTVTNPDNGNSTTPASPVLFTIQAGPSIDLNSLDGNAALPGNTTTVTIKGQNFDALNGMQVKLAHHDADNNLVYDAWTITNIQVTEGGASADTLKFTVAVPADASLDQRDIRIINVGDNGAAWCALCFGVDSLSLKNASTDGTTAVNNGSATLKVTATGLDPLNDVGSTLTLFNVKNPTLTVNAQLGAPITPTSATASIDLMAAAPGRYGAILVLHDGSQLSCTACFTVLGSQIKILSVAPSAAGQGAQDVPVTLKADAANGFFFARGSSVAIDGVTVHDVVWQDTATITIKVDIAPDATNGAKNVTVTNADGSFANTKSGAFTVNPGPHFVSVSPAALGQGAGTASTVTVVVHGTGFVKGATANDPSSTVSFGPGITVVGTPTVVDTTAGQLPPPLGAAEDDTITATVQVAPTAAVGNRDVTIINPDLGRGTGTNAFAVHAGPQITSVTPAALAPGASSTITIKGTGFSTSDPKSTLAISGIAPENITGVTVVDATTITASVTVPAGTTKGAKTLSVTNPGDQGYGSKTWYVATAPSAPTQLAVTPGGSSLTATWAPPFSDGGAPITKYLVAVVRGTTLVATKEVLVGSPLTATVTGLANGTTYSVRVAAVNAVGSGAIASVSAVPGKVTTLTAVSPKVMISGSTMTFSGKLTSGSTVLAGRIITLSFKPSVGNAFTRSATTTSTGQWIYRYTPTYTFTMRATYAGDGTYRPAAAATIPVSVGARIVRTSPASGSVSSASSTLKITGYVSPNKHGKYVYLYRVVNGKNLLVTRVLLSSSSTFTFSGRPAKGSYTFRIYIGATTGNTAAYSPSFTIKRV